MLIVLLTFIRILGIILGAYWRWWSSRARRAVDAPRPAGQTEGHQPAAQAGCLERPADKLSGVRSIQAMLRARTGSPARSSG